MLAIRKEGAESESVRIGPLRPVRTDTQRLQHLADLYDQAVDAGEPVAEYVGQHLEVSVTKRTAEGLIRRARREGCSHRRSRAGNRNETRGNHRERRKHPEARPGQAVAFPVQGTERPRGVEVVHPQDRRAQAWLAGDRSG